MSKSFGSTKPKIYYMIKVLRRNLNYTREYMHLSLTLEIGATYITEKSQ